MVDLKLNKASTNALSDPLFLREENLRESIELLFFAYRDFTAGPDRILENMTYGRAHHRVIYFVGANPGTSVGELLDILKITKQSLARVLKNLIEDGFILQEHGQNDKRKRHLMLTDKGRALELELSGSQFRLLTAAFDGAGQEAVEGFRKVLKNISIQQAEKP